VKRSYGKANLPISAEGQPTEAVLTHKRMGVFFICSVSDTNFAELFLLKLPADNCGSPGESPQTTV
jgi:hypothetical protein